MASKAVKVMPCAPSFDGIFHLLVVGQSEACESFLKHAEKYLITEKPHLKYKFHMAEHISQFVINNLADVNISCIFMIFNPKMPHIIRKMLQSVTRLDMLFFSYGRVFALEAKSYPRADTNVRESIQRFTTLNNMQLYHARFDVEASLSSVTHGVVRLGLVAAGFERGLFPKEYRTAKLHLEETEMTEARTPHGESASPTA